MPTLSFSLYEQLGIKLGQKGWIIMTSKEVLSLIGTKFYRYDENDNLEMIRILTMQNSESVKIKDLNTLVERKVNPNTIIEDYKMLNADALVMFSIVAVDAGNGTNMNDVIVSLYNMKSLKEDADNVPYCVCRQNVNDVFYDMYNPQSGTVYAGLCISKDTCPEHVDYSIMTRCNGVEYAYGVNAYIDDTLDDILECVKTTRYNRVLESVYDMYLKAYTSNPLISRVNKLDHKSLHGYCTTLRMLLEENNFMYDFNTCFGVTPIGFEMQYSDNDTTLNKHTLDVLSYLYRINMVSAKAIPYAKDIDLNKIQQNFVLVREPSNQIYLVAYKSEGEYVESEEANERMKFMRDVALAHTKEDKYFK